MAADIRTFWSALLSVLLKCIAALGFTTQERATARTQQVPAPVADRTEAVVTHAVAVGQGVVPAPEAPPVSPTTRRADVRIPAPRAWQQLPLPRRRERERTLPPTMKQRINAEAHGSSPSARSLPPGTGLTSDEFALCV